MTRTGRVVAAQQVERILDERQEDEIEVLVQMGAGRGDHDGLQRAANAALRLRRFCLSPRDILPPIYHKRASNQQKKSTASSRAILDRAAAESMALARIQEVGLASLHPLLQNGIVRAALDRMTTPAAKSARRRETIGRFWTSRSIALRLDRDQLLRLPKEVENIRAIHLNRRLSIPSVRETRAIGAETDSILASTWALERTNVLAAWGAHAARGQGITIGLLDTGVDHLHPDLKERIAHWAEFDSLGNQVKRSEPHDSADHGTHCAGTLVGGKASGRFIGVAPEAKASRKNNF
jgi:hypothetical protein